MSKIKTSFTLSPEVLTLLKLLAEKKDRSQANTIEVLVKEASVKEKIKLPE